MNAAKRATITTVLLAERFPKCFAIYDARRQPLKIRIRDDLIAALDGAITPQELLSALRFYTGNLGYLRNLRVGASRVDLNGEACGGVSESEAQHAKTLLLTRRAKKAAAAPAAPPSPTPRRDGLRDLKAAAQRRKQAQQQGSP